DRRVRASHVARGETGRCSASFTPFDVKCRHPRLPRRTTKVTCRAACKGLVSRKPVWRPGQVQRRVRHPYSGLSPTFLSLCARSYCLGRLKMYVTWVNPELPEGTVALLEEYG